MSRPAALARRSTSSITARSSSSGGRPSECERSLGPTKIRSTPSTARIASRFSTAVPVSIWIATTVSARALAIASSRSQAVERRAARAGAAQALRRVAGGQRGGLRRLGGVDQRHEHAGGAAVERVGDRARRRRRHPHQRRACPRGRRRRSAPRCHAGRTRRARRPGSARRSRRRRARARRRGAASRRSWRAAVSPECRRVRSWCLIGSFLGAGRRCGRARTDCRAARR